ncbi:hypothetical protein HDU97_010174 [Phlyctochytrium planicorne]|nr:hypothetical protein HDU97_010174 [Phlyctochytrium planicorne]
MYEGEEAGPASDKVIQEIMQAFWQQQMNEIENGPLDWKFHQLPLARIKKVMKSDEEVKSMMISAEAPLMFSKACEIFILELTMRSWIHTEENKRRTLQKPDVAMAISQADMYDFLIDIVPREENRAPFYTNRADSIPGSLLFNNPLNTMTYFENIQQIISQQQQQQAIGGAAGGRPRTITDGANVSGPSGQEEDGQQDLSPQQVQQQLQQGGDGENQ